MISHSYVPFPSAGTLPPKKELESDVVLGKVALHEIPDSKLPSCLYMIHRQLRSTPVLPSIKKPFSSSGVGLTSSYASDSAFMGGFLSPQFLCSTTSEIVQLTGCILCDWLRLVAQPSENDVKKKCTSPFFLPFPTSQCIEVFRCISHPIKEAIRLSDLPTQAGLIIERISACRVIPALLAHCNPEEVAPLVNSFFELLQVPLLAPSPSSAAGLTTSLSCDLSRILLDIIHASNNILTTAQLSILLSAVVKSSSSLYKKGGFFLASLCSSLECCSSTPDEKYDTATFSAVTSARVLLECINIVQDPLNGMVMQQITEALTGLAMVDSNEPTKQLSTLTVEKDSISSPVSCLMGAPFRDSAAEAEVRETEKKVQNSTSRRVYLLQISKSLEYFVAMAELHVDFVQFLLPNLQALLAYDNGDFRRLLLRGLGMGYASQPQVIPTFLSLFESFLEHLEDVNVQIRVDMLQMVGTIIEKAQREWLFCFPWGSPGSASVPMVQRSALHKEKEKVGEWDLWKVLFSSLEQRLLDLNSSVRLQAVNTLSNCLEKIPELLHHVDLDLERTLGGRTSDKNAKVRDVSLERLCKLYRTLPDQFKWVPESLFSAPPMEDGIKVIEIMLEKLLPPTMVPRGVSMECKTLNQNCEKKIFSPLEDKSLFELGDNYLPTRGEKKDPGDNKAYPHDAVNMNLDHFLSPSACTQLSNYHTPLEGWFHFCHNISLAHFRELVCLSKKKCLLRTTVAKLFELREKVNNWNSLNDMKAEGERENTNYARITPTMEAKQRVVHSIHRLLAFLQLTTGAKKNEWDMLFRCKDRKVAQAILHFCNHSNEEWEGERLELLHVLKGRVNTDTYTFVKSRLVVMMSFPLQLQHVSALLERLRTLHAGQSRDTNQNQNAINFNNSENSEKKNFISGTVMFRVLQVFLMASPSYYRRCMSIMTDIFCQLALDCHKFDGKCLSYFSSFSDILTSLESLLHSLRELPTALRQLISGNELSTPPSLSSVLLDSQKTVLLESLKALCTGSSPLLCSDGAKRSGNLLKEDDLKVVCSICKNSAFFLCSLRTILSTGEASEDGKSSNEQRLNPVSVTIVEKSISHISDTVLQHLHHSIRDTSNESTNGKEIMLGDSPITIIACLQTLRVFSSKYSQISSSSSPTKSTVSSSSISPEGGNLSHLSLPIMQRTIGSVLQTVCSAFCSQISMKNWPQKANPTNQEEERKLSLVAVLLVDCAAKALSAVSLASPSSERADHVGDTLDLFLGAMRKLRNVEKDIADGANSNSEVCFFMRRKEIVRLTILQQVVKLIRLPSSDMVKEIGIAVLLSLEGSPTVRHVLQEKFVSHILRSTCDMRYVAHLLLLAIPAANKNEYQELRVMVRKVGAHLRKKQLGGDGGLPISLSSPAAMECYMEYAIPFIILFLSRHPQYEVQKEKLHFIAFQRVWHLLFEELLHNGVQCVSFLRELFFRIKQAKDALQPDGVKSKVLCDLGSIVLEQLLSQYEIGTEALKRYPGVILLPNFFIPPYPGDCSVSPESVARTRYLDSCLYIPSHVPFRLPMSSLSSSTVLLADSSNCVDHTRERHSTLSGKRNREESTEKLQRNEQRNECVEPSNFLAGNELPLSLKKMRKDVDKELLCVLRERTAGLTKSEIVQLPWKELKRDVENLPSIKPYVSTIVQEENKGKLVIDEKSSLASILEDLLSIAKEELRKLYIQAKN